MQDFTSTLIVSEVMRRRALKIRSSLMFPNTFNQYRQEYYKALNHLSSKPTSGFFYPITPSRDVSKTLYELGICHWCASSARAAPPFVNIPLYLLIGYSSYTPEEIVIVKHSVYTISENNILKLG